jgi:hypothetical protein
MNTQGSSLKAVFRRFWLLASVSVVVLISFLEVAFLCADCSPAGYYQITRWAVGAIGTLVVIRALVGPSPFAVEEFLAGLTTGLSDEGMPGFWTKEGLRRRLAVGWWSFRLSGTVKLCSTAAVLWAVAGALRLYVAVSSLPVGPLSRGLAVAAFLLGIVTFLLAACAAVGVEFGFVPRFLRSWPTVVASVDAVALWAYTTNPDELRAIRRVREHRPDWTRAEALKWLAENYGHGLAALGRTEIELCNLPHREGGLPLAE